MYTTDHQTKYKTALHRLSDLFITGLLSHSCSRLRGYCNVFFPAVGPENIYIERHFDK